MYGVIDRIEEDIAVILIESRKSEWTVPASQLPRGSKPGTLLQLAVTANDVTIIGIDQEATTAASEKAETVQQKLLSKKKRSKFKRRN